MTHQELLNDWANASFSRANEFSCSISEDCAEISRKGIEYAKANGLEIPPSIVEEIRQRAEWDDENGWSDMAKLLPEDKA